MSGAALESLDRWIGREETRCDTITVAPLVALAALLDRDDKPPLPGEAAPPLAHWLYFLPSYRESEAGSDGHARRGGFLPEVALPRRMWAGSRIAFTRPLVVGSEVTRVSRITDVATKQGRSGALVFVTVRHEIRDAGGTVLVDEHDIVYRGESAAPAAPVPAPGNGEWRREIRPDPLLLFRYSAVTFNGHRIHYDHPYATGVEGYPGLVVHGPLVATLLVDLLRREQPNATLRAFRFKALRPLFDNAPFSVCGAREADARRAHLWAMNTKGALAMDATAQC